VDLNSQTSDIKCESRKQQQLVISNLPHYAIIPPFLEYLALPSNITSTSTVGIYEQNTHDNTHTGSKR
jgi:hypothetical protein